MKTNFPSNSTHMHPTFSPIRSTVRRGMNQPDTAAPPAGDTVSLQTPPAYLSEAQLQSHWNKLNQALYEYDIKLPEAQKLAVLQRILDQIPPTQCMEFLVKTDNDGETILHKAALSGSPAVIQALLAAVPDEAQRKDFLMKTNNNRDTALHRATLLGNTAAIQALLAAVPDEVARIDFLMKTDRFGETALHDSVRRYYPASATKALLAAVPDQAQRLKFLKKTNDMGCTALHELVQDGSYPAKVQALLEAVPDKAQRNEFLMQTNNLGHTVLRTAISCHNLDMAGLLWAYGADCPLLTPEERADILNHAINRRDQHVNTLLNPQAPVIPVDPRNPEAAQAKVRAALQAKVRGALQWLQAFPPNGGKLDWKETGVLRQAHMEARSQDSDLTPEERAEATEWLQTYRTPAQKCNAYLKNKVAELAVAPTKQDKKAILNRTWPVILAAGADCDPNLILNLGKEADQIGGPFNDFAWDVLNVLGGKGAPLLIESLKKQQEAE